MYFLTHLQVLVDEGVPIQMGNERLQEMLLGFLSSKRSVWAFLAVTAVWAILGYLRSDLELAPWLAPALCRWGTLVEISYTAWGKLQTFPSLEMMIWLRSWTAWSNWPCLERALAPSYTINPMILIQISSCFAEGQPCPPTGYFLHKALCSTATLMLSSMQR